MNDTRHPMPTDTSCNGAALAHRIFEHTCTAIMATDLAGTIVEVNAAFTRLTGYVRHEAVGKNARLLQSGQMDEAFYRQLWDSLHRDGHWHGEIVNRRKDRSLLNELLSISTLYDGTNRPTHYVGIFQDLSIYKENMRRLEWMAHHDPLTALPNRALLADRMEQSLARAQRDDSLVAVCYLDMDGLKAVNDRYGHNQGDRLLEEAARRMKQQLRGGDTVARVGGDEFVLLLTDLGDRPGIVHIVERLLSALTAPLAGTPDVIPSASIGITVFPWDCHDGETLLQHADEAMYAAKKSGRATYRFFL